MDPISLVMIVGAGAAFYFLIIRPNQQRQKKQREMMKSLAPGTKVMTSAGLFGTVTGSTDEEITLEVAPGVEMRFIPAAVSRVIETPGLPVDPVD